MVYGDKTQKKRTHYATKDQPHHCADKQDGGSKSKAY